MNRSKKLYILLGVLLAVCLATFIAMHMEQRREEIRTSGDVILEIAPDTVQSLSWEYEGNTLAFHKDGHWRYDADEAFPVSEEKIASLLAPFESFGVSFTIENVEDFGQYGLDTPICTIDLGAGGETRRILLGDFSTMDAQRYVSIGDGNVYLVQNDPLDVFDATLRDLIQNDAALSYDSVSAISLAGEERCDIFHDEDSDAALSDSDVYFTERNGQTLALDSFKVENYLRTVSSLDLTDYVTYNATDAELADCGLDDPDLTMTVDYTAKNEEGKDESGTYVLHVSRDPAEKETAGDADAETEETITAYARVGESPILYHLDAESYKTLIAAGCDDLRHDAVLWADFADVEQIDVTLEGEQYTITSEKGGEERTYAYEGETVDAAGLKAALEALTAESFTDEAPTEKEEISLTVSLDNENIPQVSIGLYRYDGTRCLATVDGKPAALVTRAAAVELMESIRAIVWE